MRTVEATADGLGVEAVEGEKLLKCRFEKDGVGEEHEFLVATWTRYR
jgi:hypothetical protein